MNKLCVHVLRKESLNKKKGAAVFLADWGGIHTYEGKNDDFRETAIQTNNFREILVLSIVPLVC